MYIYIPRHCLFYSKALRTRARIATVRRRKTYRGARKGRSEQLLAVARLPSAAVARLPSANLSLAWQLAPRSPSSRVPARNNLRSGTGRDWTTPPQGFARHTDRPIFPNLPQSTQQIEPPPLTRMWFFHRSLPSIALTYLNFPLPSIRCCLRSARPAATLAIAGRPSLTIPHSPWPPRLRSYAHPAVISAHRRPIGWI